MGFRLGSGLRLGLRFGLELGLWLGLGLGSRCSSVFLLFRSGGWVGGEMEIKANLSLSLVEVEAELGKNIFWSLKAKM